MNFRLDVYTNLLLRFDLNLFPAAIKISWRVPSGQMEEQYTLPNRNVSNNISRNPRDDTAKAIAVNLNSDGKNCKRNKNSATGSTSRPCTFMKKSNKNPNIRRDTTILIFLR
jgi:hypothetical protein